MTEHIPNGSSLNLTRAPMPTYLKSCLPRPANKDISSSLSAQTLQTNDCKKATGVGIEKMGNAMCPWDSAGKLIPGVTVRQWAEFLRGKSLGGNVTIDRVYYNLHSLLIAPPDEVNLDAIIVALDNGYYGTYGVLTK